MTATDVDVVVVGGGISGLAAAFGLQKSGYAVELLEAQPRVGGVIGSRRRDGVLYELGPNSTLDTTPLINELLDDVGLRQQRAEPSAAASIRYVVRDGKPIPLPTSAGGFLTTPAFTLAAKLRLFKELFIAPTPPGVASWPITTTGAALPICRRAAVTAVSTAHSMRCRAAKPRPGSARSGCGSRMA